MAVEPLQLDTNAYSALMRGHPKVLGYVRFSRRIQLSVVVIAELITGFRRGNQERKNRDLLEHFLGERAVVTLDIGEGTAEHYSSICNELRAKGRPIPTNDIWIAAQARETGGKLLTFDKHFQEIADLEQIYLG